MENFLLDQHPHSLLRVTSDRRINAASGCIVLEKTVADVVGRRHAVTRSLVTRTQIVVNFTWRYRFLWAKDLDFVEASNSRPIVAIKTLGYLFPTSVFPTLQSNSNNVKCVYIILKGVCQSWLLASLGRGVARRVVGCRGNMIASLGLLLPFFLGRLRDPYCPTAGPVGRGRVCGRVPVLRWVRCG